MTTQVKQIVFITIHPEFIQSYLGFGPFKALIEQNKLKVHVVDLRDFAIGNYRRVDDSPYGGGDGMVIRADVLEMALLSTQSKLDLESADVFFSTPSAPVWHDQLARNELLQWNDKVFICGRFGGIDERFIDRYVTRLYSIGDFVLAGGELPSLAMAESICRFIPGALGNDASADQDSFGPLFDGQLEGALYTRPKVWHNMEVPDVLMSGNHHDINSWRKESSKQATKRRYQT